MMNEYIIEIYHKIVARTSASNIKEAEVKAKSILKPEQKLLTITELRKHPHES
jgi:hypothetical protein